VVHQFSTRSTFSAAAEAWVGGIEGLVERGTSRSALAGCVDSTTAERQAKAFTAGTVKGAVAGPQSRNGSSAFELSQGKDGPRAQMRFMHR
jgi:hypothetical protein